MKEVGIVKLAQINSQKTQIWCHRDFKKAAQQRTTASQRTFTAQSLSCVRVLVPGCVVVSRIASSQARTLRDARLVRKKVVMCVGAFSR